MQTIGLIMDRAKATEEEYFRREESEKRAEESHATAQATAHAERAAHDRAVALAVQRCPSCRIALGAETLRGEPVARCASCGGVWLHAGQLEALTRRRPPLFDRLRGFFGGRRSADAPED